MSQPVQQQSLYESRVQAQPLNDQIQQELLELYHRSDNLLRELSTVRRRMDELHAAMGGQPITLPALRHSMEQHPQANGRAKAKAA